MDPPASIPPLKAPLVADLPPQLPPVASPASAVAAVPSTSTAGWSQIEISRNSCHKTETESFASLI